MQICEIQVWDPILKAWRGKSKGERENERMRDREKSGEKVERKWREGKESGDSLGSKWSEGS